MSKHFNNQFATQKLRQETSMTNSGGSTFTPGPGEQPGPIATKKVKKAKKEEKDVEPKYAAGKAKIYMKDKWGWKYAPSIPNRPSKGGFIYKQIFEGLEVDDRVKVVYGNEFYGETGTIVDIIKGFAVIEMDHDGKEYSMHVSDVEKIEDEDTDFLQEASVPDNIKKFAQRKGITNIVNQAARWAEKAGKRIVGGTAIGKNYDTLILDLTHNGSEIYIYCDDESIEVKGRPVDNYESFKNALSQEKDFYDSDEDTDFKMDEILNRDDYKKAIELLNKIQDKSSALYNTILDIMSDIYPHDLEKELGDHIKAAGLNEGYDHLRYLVSDLRDLYYASNDPAFKKAVVDAIPDSEKYSYILASPEDHIKKLMDLQSLIPQARLTNPNRAAEIIKNAIEFFQDKQPLQENYSKFKTETKTRGKSDQFHQAVRAVKKKVLEINRLFEYVSRLKSELSEGKDGLKYKMHTEKALAKIKEMVNELNKNVKKFK